MSDYRQNLADELAIDRDAPRLNTNTEPPADVVEALAKLTDAFLSRHGCFPTDTATPEQREWHEAMQLAYSIVGQPNTPERVAALSAQPAPSQSGVVEACQICGGEAVISHSYGIAQNGWQVECAKDMEIGDGSHSTGLFETEAEALQTWSTRTNNQTAPDDWKVGDTFKLDNEDAWTSGIDVGDWGNRIEVYGHTEHEATGLRDRILSALTAKDQTALLKEVATAWRDRQSPDLLTRIDQALATKGDGE